MINVIAIKQTKKMKVKWNRTKTKKIIKIHELGQTKKILYGI